MVAPAELLTVRDWLRYAVSRFNAAGLVYGHGTGTALDEAAFMILARLKLPIDTLEPFLDARLTAAERADLNQLIEARISTRKPAPYLLNEAWIGPVRFYVDERVIVPRSFLAELVSSGLEGVVSDAGEVRGVLDLCTGSGCIAILAAMQFANAVVDATELSPGAAEVARRNVSEHGLEERVQILEGDLFAPVAGKTYDIILANPPYVDREAMEVLPPEFRAEPTLALDGGEDGLDIVHRILAGAPRHLDEGGALVVEIGRGRERLEAAYPALPFLWLDTEASEGEVFALSAEALTLARGGGRVARPGGTSRRGTRKPRAGAT